MPRTSRTARFRESESSRSNQTGVSPTRARPPWPSEPLTTTFVTTIARLRDALRPGRRDAHSQTSDNLVDLRPRNSVEPQPLELHVGGAQQSARELHPHVDVLDELLTIANQP